MTQRMTEGKCGGHVWARVSALRLGRGAEGDVAGEHILIVDDEPAIRSTLRDVLERRGTVSPRSAAAPTPSASSPTSCPT